jgi:putative spermidine/putrescine transport system permease protein
VVSPTRRKIPHFGTAYWTMAVIAFVLAPLLVAAINSIGSSELASFPPHDFSLVAYTHISSRWVESIGTSLLVSLCATLIGIFVGTCAAFALARGALMLASLIETGLRLPLQVPAVVLGIAFLFFYAGLRAATGLDLRDTLGGLILAHSIYAVPLVLSVALPALLAFDRQLEEAAFGLGAGKWETLFRVTLPLLAPAIFAGGFLAFFMSFDNLPLSLFLVGSAVKMFPVELFAGIQFEVTRTVYAVATLVAVGSGFVVVVAYRALKTVTGVHSS